MQILKEKSWWIVCIIVLTLTLGVGSYLYIATAEEDAVAADPVTLESLDYNTMEVSLNTNGNVVVYYSTNKKTWYEADATITSSAGKQSMLYDISWLTYGKTVYFRGNIDKTICIVKLPASNKKLKVKFSKADGTFDFDNTNGAEVVRWRKTTDYNWHYVWLNSKPTVTMDSENEEDKKYCEKYGVKVIQSMQNFLNEVNTLRAKPVKLLF